MGMTEKGMTFVPAASFLGFPPGSGRAGVAFVKGVETGPHPTAFVALMQRKGLAASVGAVKAEAATPAASHKPGR